jgi:hypothetical protein
MELFHEEKEEFGKRLGDERKPSVKGLAFKIVCGLPINFETVLIDSGKY